MGTRIKIVIGVVVVAVLAVVAVSLLTGDDDSKPKSAQSGSTTSAAKPGGEKSGGSDSGSGSEPALRTVIVKRDEGKYATAQAGALIRDPREIWIRVSVAPKQPVRITWSLACGSGSASQDNYVATPPHMRQLKLPKNAKTCAGSVAGQIVDGTGRLKVALLRDR